jgi:uncharacterized membrane protein
MVVLVSVLSGGEIMPGPDRRLRVLAGCLMALTLILTGAIAGFFYAYTSSVMRGLDAVPAAQAIVAMQGINATVRNWLFAPAFFGTPVAAVVTGALLGWLHRRGAAGLMFLAAIIYIVGAVLPTLLVNVPMNETLATVTVPADPQAADHLWREYSAPWIWWNTLRTLFSFASLLLVGLAIFVSARR